MELKLVTGAQCPSDSPSRRRIPMHSLVISHAMKAGFTFDGKT